MVQLLIILALLNVGNLVVLQKILPEGYCWRDYTNEIPMDALPGGSEANGNPIYIGQVLFDVYLVPAKIYTDKKISFEYGGKEHHSSPNVKILCSQHPEQFEWIATNNKDIKLLTNKHLVIGGYDKPGTTTYIGRIRIGGEITIGKVLTDIWADAAGLHITRNGRGERHTSFEVLSFNDDVRLEFD